MIGDSHGGALEFNLNEEIKKKDLSLIRFGTSLYLTDFKLVNKKTAKIDNVFNDNNIKIDNFLKENSNLIVVFHHRWTIRFLETFFDNEEGYKEEENLEFDSYLIRLFIVRLHKILVMPDIFCKNVYTTYMNVLFIFIEY